MMETYKQLKELAGLYRGTEDANLIALDYQLDEDATKLAYVFCENIGLIHTVADKYFGLTPDDVSSFALEELHKAMMSFKTGSAKLVTLYSKFLNNRLRVETQSLGYDKRKSNTMTDSYDGDMDDDNASSLSNTLGYEEDDFSEIEMLLSLTEKEELTENEYRYCEIIIKEVSDVTQIKDSEIASRLNISSAAVHYIKKNLQKKIGIRTNSNCLLNF